MKRATLALVLLFFVTIVSGHPWKPSHYVIIDTDGGVDDMRAISLLLASHDVRVLGITVSAGALDADQAYIKVRSLLNNYHHEGIRTGINRNVPFSSPSFEYAKTEMWGIEKGISAGSAPDHLTLIKDIFSQEKTKISFILLGSPATAMQAMRSIEGFRDHIKDFIWSADGADDLKGFNYIIDKTASESLLKQEIPVKIVRGIGVWEEHRDL